MSRLFTRLENIGQEGSDRESPSPPGAEPAPDSNADAGPAGTAVGTAVPVPMPPLVPGYAGAPDVPLAAPASSARPAWTVKLWFSSLVLIVALSLAVLFMPRQQWLGTHRPTGVVQSQPVTAAPEPARSAPAEAAFTPAPPAAMAPAPQPPARTEAEPAPARPAASRAAAPAANAASCTEAMLALNLCATPSP